MRTHLSLVDRSREILRNGQEPSGAFLACPTFPVYRYCWFRDSTFIAQALDMYGDHEPARRFYDWGVNIVLSNTTVIDAACSVPVGAVPDLYLHTRYAPDGSHGGEDWPNFQLDGFGTFLWGMRQHVYMTHTVVPAEWTMAAEQLTRYLTHLWRSPNFDCWEEYPDKLHIATLAAVYGGLCAASDSLGVAGAQTTAREIRTYVYQHAEHGYLPKFVGSKQVDSSLLWACIPYSMFTPQEPIMVRTIERVVAELQGSHGGIHRYPTDEYYGGGAWVLLTAALGECYAALGDMDRAKELLTWIEAQASATGELPEQVAIDLIQPPSFDQWVGRWGDIAQPLLWSHAAYLRLARVMHTHAGTQSR